MAVHRLRITEELDLHTFQPRDYPDLLETYLAECRRAGIRQVRIVHGKGTGFQRRRVREILAGLAAVTAFADAPPEAGGWGATVVQLAPAGGDRPAPEAPAGGKKP